MPGALKRAHVPLFPAGGAHACGEKILDGKPVGARSTACSIASATCWSTGRCATAWASRNLRVAYTAGEAIGPDLFSFFRSLGINLKQLYGQTEASVFITLQPDGEVYPETVGKPVPGVEMKIADSGEVLFKSPGVFLKYYKNDEATAATKTADGWVRTGDAGFIDQRGHLQHHRSRQGCRQARRRRAVRAQVHREQAEVLPEIKEAVAFGHGRDFVDGRSSTSTSTVGRQLGRAQRHRLFASYQELAAQARGLRA